MQRYNFTNGSVTLQQAFDNGNTISLDNGPITITSGDGTSLLASDVGLIFSSALVDPTNVESRLTSATDGRFFSQISGDGAQPATNSFQIVYPLATDSATFSYDVKGKIFVFGAAGPMLINFTFVAIRPEAIAPSSSEVYTINPNYTASVAYGYGAGTLIQTITFSDASSKFIDYYYSTQSFF